MTQEIITVLWAGLLQMEKESRKRTITGKRKFLPPVQVAAIYRRELLDKTGLFDEEHFAYLEDLDIGYRGRLLGYENWFCPKARVLHVGSGTTGSRYNLFKVRLFIQE